MDLDLVALLGQSILKLVLPVGPGIAAELYHKFNNDHSELTDSVQSFFTQIYVQIITVPNPIIPPTWYRSWSKVLQQLTQVKDNIALGSEHEYLRLFASNMIETWRKAGEALSFEWRPLTRCDNPKCEDGGALFACESCCSAFYCSRSCQQQHWSYPSVDVGHSWNCRVPEAD
ncbi:hypothetical protein BDV93DRAFT_84626 [Ceratobasidium sp. AG-I]|nr:hypothetical protein BDV93DRAFT_84626 [Ceratobasidium sp. AG-I]